MATIDFAKVNLPTRLHNAWQGLIFALQLDEDSTICEQLESGDLHISITGSRGEVKMTIPATQWSLEK